MKLRLSLLAACVALAAVPAVAFGFAAHTSSNSQTFQDSTGEDPNAPDITTIQVSNDDSGLITFKINIANRPTLAQDMAIVLFVDADANPSTGDTQNDGAEYLIELDPGSVSMAKWNGSDYVDTPETSLVYSYDSTGATIRVKAVELGATKKFNFYALAASGIAVDATGNPDFTNVHIDYAPDPNHGDYTYTVIAKLTLKLTAFATTPNQPKAGARLSASLGASESDTAAPVTKATIACTATVAGKKLPATHSLANGVGTCYWQVPKTVKGKTLSGSISMTVQGTVLKKTFSKKIG